MRPQCLTAPRRGPKITSPGGRITLRPTLTYLLDSAGGTRERGLVLQRRRYPAGARHRGGVEAPGGRRQAPAGRPGLEGRHARLGGGPDGRDPVPEGGGAGRGRRGRPPVPAPVRSRIRPRRRGRRPLPVSPAVRRRRPPALAPRRGRRRPPPGPAAAR